MGEVLLQIGLTCCDRCRAPQTHRNVGDWDTQAHTRAPAAGSRITQNCHNAVSRWSCRSQLWRRCGTVGAKVGCAARSPDVLRLDAAKLRGRFAWGLSARRHLARLSRPGPETLDRVVVNATCRCWTPCSSTPRVVISPPRPPTRSFVPCSMPQSSPEQRRAVSRRPGSSCAIRRQKPRWHSLPGGVGKGYPHNRGHPRAMSSASFHAADHLANHLEEAPVWIFGAARRRARRCRRVPPSTVPSSS